jgi:hypothetical protein
VLVDIAPTMSFLLATRGCLVKLASTLAGKNDFFRMIGFGPAARFGGIMFRRKKGVFAAAFTLGLAAGQPVQAQDWLGPALGILGGMAVNQLPNTLGQNGTSPSSSASSGYDCAGNINAYERNVAIRDATCTHGPQPPRYHSCESMNEHIALMSKNILRCPNVPAATRRRATALWRRYNGQIEVNAETYRRRKQEISDHYRRMYGGCPAGTQAVGGGWCRRLY